jgi:hypothetical protein
MQRFTVCDSVDSLLNHRKADLAAGSVCIDVAAISLYFMVNLHVRKKPEKNGTMSAKHDEAVEQ